MTQPRLYRALCDLLRTDRSPGLPELTRAEWAALPQAANAQGVAPLAAARLGELGWPDAIAAGTQAALRRAAYTTAAHSRLIYQALELAAAVAAQHGAPGEDGGLPVVALKGAALAATLYPDPSLRPVRDLDVLVPEAAAAQVVTGLGRHGYTAHLPEVAPGVNAAVRFHEHLRGGPGGQISIEVHWGLVAGPADWRAPDLAWFWAHAQPWAGPARGPRFAPPLRQLDPTATLLHSAAHLALQHGGAQARLIWYYDLHLLLEQEGAAVDWEDLSAQAQALGWAPALYAALRAVRARFGTCLPEASMTQLAAALDSRASRLVARKAALGQTRLALNWRKLSSLDGPARLRLVAGLIWPSAAYMRWRYRPRRAWLWPLYYPVRWVDVLGDLLRTIGQTLTARTRAAARRRAVS